MPAPASLDADPIRFLLRLSLRLLGRTRGAAPSPSAAPLTHFAVGHGCCPCSVELPGEAA
jgi:hypothetical protein